MKKFFLCAAVLGCVAFFGSTQTAEAHGPYGSRGSNFSLYIGNGYSSFGYSTSRRGFGYNGFSSAHYHPRRYSYGHVHRHYVPRSSVYRYHSYSRYPSRYGFCR